jgi:ferredoxin
LASGDFACRLISDFDTLEWNIVGNTANAVSLEGSTGELLPEVGDQLEIVIYLQQPYVDPAKCIGCGICEHECPVRGRAAIRVSAEGETRDPSHRILA